MSSVSYLGSKIWLVSKSEIKYEGILYTIDIKESTVTLAKVRCFGTEDRPTDCPVAPTDDVYEYIIFRATDIKDLSVCESAKQQALLPSGLANDPAIVQHSAPLPPSAMNFSQTPLSHMYGMSLPHYPSQMGYSHVLPTLFPGSGSRSGASSQTSLKSATTDAGVQVSSGDKEEAGSRGSLSDSSLRAKSRDGQQEQSSNQRRQMNQSRAPQRGRGGRRGRGRGRGGAPFIFNYDTLKFDGEYDFEQANEEFKLLETKLAGIKLDNREDHTDADAVAEDDAEQDTSYDRQKSFFDNISCEASRVAKGIPRFDWRVERKLNMETFGMALSNSWFRRRRGRGNFRRGGSFQRGRTTQQATSETLKTVTFAPDEILNAEPPSDVPVEIPKEEIPVIEVIEEKEPEWKETTTEEEWNTEPSAVKA